MQYRIGEVQKILGISPETLRYFEKMKIIESKRYEHNQYRYYETEDINKIFVYKMYRSMDFTMEEATALVSGKSIQYLQQKLRDHKDRLEERKNMLEEIISNLAYSCEVLDEFSQEEHPFELGTTEDMYFFENQQEDRFLINEEKRKMVNECFQHLHACVPTFRYTYQQINSIVYGYGILSDTISSELAKMGSYIGQKQCFHGVVKLTNKEDIYQPVFEKIKEAEKLYHLECNSEIYGRMYHEEIDGDNVTWYHEIWAITDKQ